jgi:hypothetical protein
MSFKSHILALPISKNVSEHTISRFYLFILPFFGLLHTFNPAEAEKQLKSFFKLLAESSYPLSQKFSA